MPAQAGIQYSGSLFPPICWIPAFAGMTSHDNPQQKTYL